MYIRDTQKLGEITLPRLRDERRLPSRSLYWSSRTVQIATKWNLIEIVPQICSFGCTGLNPQGSKSKRVIAERGQKVVATKRSNSRENVTVVATINAAGEAMPPLIIFKGQRLQEDWIRRDVGVPGATYAVTDSSMVQGPVFFTFFRKFHEYLVDNGKIDGKPHVIVLDGHASHLTLEVIKFAMDNNLAIFQLPSHS